MKFLRPTIAVAVGVLFVCLMAGCGSTAPSSRGDSSQADSASSPATVDAKAASLLPSDIHKKGVLTVATQLSWPPYTYTADGKPVGTDISLITAIAQKLGLEAKFSNIDAATLMPGIQNGRYDVSVTQLTITPQRKKVVDFVPYMVNRMGLMIRKDDAGKLSPAHLCGHTLVGTTGTGTLEVAQTYSKVQCVGRGKPAIKFITVASTPDTVLALSNGRGEGFIADKAVGHYLAQHGTNLEMAPGIFPAAASQSGIAVSKERPKLRRAIALALVDLLKNGEYRDILSQGGIGSQTLSANQILHYK